MRWAGRLHGGALAVVGALMIVATRIDGCHMTEGEILSEYWGRLLVAGIIFALGLLIFADTFDRKPRKDDDR